MTRTIFIIGVSGTGKTTIAMQLSNKLAVQYLEGDDYHPNKNIEKMRSGQPLNDEDRQSWLENLNSEAIRMSNNNQDVVITCSALKEKYRKILTHNLNTEINWVYLKGSFDLIKSRMEKRNHFMPAALLQSQFDILEEPQSAIVVDVTNPIEIIINQIIKEINA